VIDVLDTIARQGAAPWVIEIYHRKLGNEFANIPEQVAFMIHPYSGGLTLEDAERFIPIFEQSSAAREAASKAPPRGILTKLPREHFDVDATNPENADRRFAIYQRIVAALQSDD
jgi:hypothetical protein